MPPAAPGTTLSSSATRTTAARDVAIRGAISNLEGSANDAQAVAQVITARFGFRRPDVRLLVDKAATRAAILDSLTAMLARSNAGDVAFFAFAGHGALRRNSLTPGKQLDQTLVPVDANAGVEDIRDRCWCRSPSSVESCRPRRPSMPSHATGSGLTQWISSSPMR